MKHVVTFGEIMLRLKPPGRERFFQSPFFEASFGGAEANVAVGLARLGVPVEFVSAVPDNAIAEACLGELRGHGVGTGHVARRGERLGIYYLETGADLRPSRVLYDRAHSALADSAPGDIDWASAFNGAAWLHVTGITPALSWNAAVLTTEAVESAKAQGMVVSVDLNHREQLWRWGQDPKEVMRALVSRADLVIGNESDCQKALGIGEKSLETEGAVDLVRAEELTDAVLDAFPNLARAALTVRVSHSADNNDWSAVLNTRDTFHSSRVYHVTDIVDRLGAGDSFAAGLVYGLLRLAGDADALEFATAFSALKHTIPGDLPLVTRDEVELVLAGETSGRIRR